MILRGNEERSNDLIVEKYLVSLWCLCQLSQFWKVNKVKVSVFCTKIAALVINFLNTGCIKIC